MCLTFGVSVPKFVQCGTAAVTCIFHILVKEEYYIIVRSR